MELDIIKDDDMDAILKDIVELYGYDFTQYSRASLKRRLNRICIIDKFSSFSELRYKLLKDKSYLKHFIEEITVNVTEMFRDPHFYAALREDVLPKLRSYPFIRIWVAGCATGEEVYSLAILLKELGLYERSRIYATDINPSVLESASKGIFPLHRMKQYSENYIHSGGQEDFSSYYVCRYDMAKIDSSLKTNVVFATHNLVSDSSFNEFQLILCRNVLIYFDKDLQNRVFKLFDDSLQQLGYLALGAKETLQFSAIEHQYKQYAQEKIWRKTR